MSTSPPHEPTQPPPEEEEEPHSSIPPSDNSNSNGANGDSDTSTSSPLILYRPPTFWGLLRGAAINLVLPFVNGLMMGFGELLAHEAAFRLGWSGTRVCVLRFFYTLVGGLERRFVDWDVHKWTGKS